VTRKELTAALVKIELDLLSRRDLTDLAHVREVKQLLFLPESQGEIGEENLSFEDLNTLATAVEGKLPP